MNAYQPPDPNSPLPPALQLALKRIQDLDESDQSEPPPNNSPRPWQGRNIKLLAYGVTFTAGVTCLFVGLTSRPNPTGGNGPQALKRSNIEILVGAGLIVPTFLKLGLEFGKFCVGVCRGTNYTEDPTHYRREES